MTPNVAVAVGAVLRDKALRPDTRDDDYVAPDRGEREALTLFIGLCVNIARIAESLDKKGST